MSGICKVRARACTEAFARGLRLRHRRVHANLCSLRSMFPHGNIQLVEFCREESRPRTTDRLDSPKLVIMVGIPLLENRDPTFSSDRIDPATLLIVEDVVAVADLRKEAQHAYLQPYP